MGLQQATPAHVWNTDRPGEKGLLGSPRPQGDAGEAEGRLGPGSPPVSPPPCKSPVEAAGSSAPQPLDGWGVGRPNKAQPTEAQDTCACVISPPPTPDTLKTEF